MCCIDLLNPRPEADIPVSTSVAYPYSAVDHFAGEVLAQKPGTLECESLATVMRISALCEESDELSLVMVKG
jgi:hypothetical protein